MAALSPQLSVEGLRLLQLRISNPSAARWGTVPRASPVNNGNQKQMFVHQDDVIAPRRILDALESAATHSELPTDEMDNLQKAERILRDCCGGSAR